MRRNADSSDGVRRAGNAMSTAAGAPAGMAKKFTLASPPPARDPPCPRPMISRPPTTRTPTIESEEHTSELQSRQYLVCPLLLEKKKNTNPIYTDLFCTLGMLITPY